MAGNGGFQETMEKNLPAMLLVVAILLSIGGLVTVVPLFYLKNTWGDENKNPEISAVKPYTALQLAGRDVYIKEGCYTCHSQMIRPLRDEKERYGHYSLAAESKYDHPFQWGSKRTGPDLARVGGKYSNEWHYAHMMDPRAVVPESVMPRYPWLAQANLDAAGITGKMEAMKMLGVPYSKEEIAEGPEMLKNKTEMDAIIAYLQVLGTFIKFDEGKDYRE